jgi:tellurite resistance protein TerC
MKEIYFWILFNIFVLGMLLLDLVVLNKKAGAVKVKEALWWTAFWVGLAFAFNVIVYFWKGKEPALQFLTGYLIEESLSVDNLFVFMLIFNYFAVPQEYQRKVLFWGIIGALVFRAVFILVGVTLIHHFHWTIYILGAFLIITGVKMAVSQDKEINPEKNPIISLVNKFMRVSNKYDNGNFFTRLNGQLLATPLFIVVLVIETTDIIFAADSIPAILAISKDPFIVYTSNVFALLGLRSLYFALAGIMQLFHYLHYGLSIILVFIGFKLMVSDVEALKIDMMVALLVVAVILVGSVLLSIMFPKKPEDSEGNEIDHPQEHNKK